MLRPPKPTEILSGISVKLTDVILIVFSYVVLLDGSKINKGCFFLEALKDEVLCVTVVVVKERHT